MPSSRPAASRGRSPHVWAFLFFGGVLAALFVGNIIHALAPPPWALATADALLVVERGTVRAVPWPHVTGHRLDGRDLVLELGATTPKSGNLLARSPQEVTLNGLADAAPSLLAGKNLPLRPRPRA